MNRYRDELYKQKNDDLGQKPSEIGYAELPQLTGDICRQPQPHYRVPAQWEQDNRYRQARYSYRQDGN